MKEEKIEIPVKSDVEKLFLTSVHKWQLPILRTVQSRYRKQKRRKNLFFGAGETTSAYHYTRARMYIHRQ